MVCGGLLCLLQQHGREPNVDQRLISPLFDVGGCVALCLTRHQPDQRLLNHPRFRNAVCVDGATPDEVQGRLGCARVVARERLQISEFGGDGTSVPRLPIHLYLCRASLLTCWPLILCISEAFHTGPGCRSYVCTRQHAVERYVFANYTIS